MRLSTFSLTALATIASAQSASQLAACDALAAQIPACSTACDEAGFAAVGCGPRDYVCHCSHAKELTTIVPGCLKNSTCTPADLATFAPIPAKICAIVANVTSSTSSSNSSTTTSTKGSGSATATPSGPSSTTSGSGASATASGSAAMNAASMLLMGAGVGIMGLFL